jgi:ribosome-associated protein
MRPRGASPENDDLPSPPSKTRRKQQMHALQALGEELVALDPKRLATLALPERLADAIALARTLTRHEARRRQLQYVGRLMRDVDPEPLRAALAQWAHGHDRERARFALVERWRDRLLQEADGVRSFVAAFPAASRDRFEELVAEARDERSRGRPPHKARALFREIERVVAATTP